MPNINFANIQIYLDAIANKTGIDMNSTPHRAFWKIAYHDFLTGVIPHVKCNGNDISIVDQVHPLRSPFFLILIDSNGFCGKEQMPGGGPFITDAGYTITLPDNSTLTGQQIQDNISSWLTNGFPEN